MRVPWLADVLRAAGLAVVEQPGWKDYRPTYNLLSSANAPATLQGVVVHHTASPTKSTLNTNLHVVTNGNSLAPGPIAQLMLWRDGTWYCIGAGKANHAGKGGPLPWLPADTANDRCIGIEAVNDGVGDQWGNVMLDSYELGVAALLDHMELDAERIVTHHEWAPTRKIDPAGPNGFRYPYLNPSMTWSGEAFRDAVEQRMTPTVPPITPTLPVADSSEDEMVFARKKGKNAVWAIQGRTRTHINDDAQLLGLVALTGGNPVLILDAEFDLNQFDCVGANPGDV